MERPIPYHPLLAAIAPVLLLLSANAQYVSPGTALRPIAILMAVTACAWLLTGLLFRSLPKSATVTTVAVAAVTLTGPVISMLPRRALIERPVEILPQQLGGTLLIVLWVILLYLSLRTSKAERTTAPLNAILACLVAVPLLNIGYHSLTTPRPVAAKARTVENIAPVHHPDIFYILPDAYARADILQDLYGFDNGAFLTGLTNMGFRVCEESRSNYCQTGLSAASTFNMDYLDEPDEATGVGASGYRDEVLQLLRDSGLLAKLRGAGYEIISYNSGYRGTALPAADRFVTLTGSGSEFERVFWSLVALPFRGLPFLQYIPSLDPYIDHATRITGTLDSLPNQREGDSPVFVFAHVICPHPPFVFGANGERVRPEYSFRYGDADMIIPEHISREDYVKGYVAQVRFLNQRLLQTVRSIQDASSDPCIIVVQSDHGARSQLVWENPSADSMKEAFAILNAYYVPDEVEAKLYEGITPVNTFRLILNYCLGIDLPLLEDRSYFSKWSTPYDFIDVTELARGRQDPAAARRLTEAE